MTKLLIFLILIYLIIKYYYKYFLDNQSNIKDINKNITDAEFEEID